MRRRTLLAALGTGLATAGCLGSATGPGADGGESPNSPADTATPPGSATRTGTPTSNARPSGTPATPDEPVTEPPRGRFEGEPCPSFSDTDRTVCWHTRKTADVYLSPSTQVFQPVSGNDTLETMTFTLHNESDETVSLNPYAWAIKHRTENGAWQHVAPDAYPKPLVERDPGETYEWVLSVRQHPSPRAERQLQITANLGGGLHAFAVTAFVGGGKQTLERKSTVECVALFDVAMMVADAGEPTGD